MNTAIVDIVDESSRAFTARGLTMDEARMVTDQLLDAEFSGRPSHGFVRVQRICQMLESAPVTDITVVTETPVSVLLDGGNKPGFVVARRATQIAIEKARKSFVGMAGGFNTDTIGVAGYYSRLAASEGFISILTCNSTSKIPPWGSIDAVMGTNPLAIGIPTASGSIILDFSCSKITFGEVLLAMKRSTNVPEGVLIDSDGRPSIDPSDVTKGALLAIGDHKGAGLALMLEILAGPLVRAKAGRNAVPGSWGFFMIVFDPTAFVPQEDFYDKVGRLVAEIRTSRTREDVDEILLPGERSDRERTRNARRTKLDLPESVIDDIHRLALTSPKTNTP